MKARKITTGGQAHCASSCFEAQVAWHLDGAVGAEVEGPTAKDEAKGNAAAEHLHAVRVLGDVGAEGRGAPLALFVRVGGLPRPHVLLFNERGEQKKRAGPVFRERRGKKRAGQ